MKRALAIVAALVLGAGAAPNAAAQAEPRSVTIVAAGDIIIHEAIAVQARANARGAGYDFTPMFEQIEPWIGYADLAICHLEGTLSADNVGLTYQHGYDHPAYFYGPGEMAYAVAAAGFDTCSTASNHSWDNGWRGLEDTLVMLDRAGVAHAGTARNLEETRPSLHEIDGVTVAHIAYSMSMNAGLRQEPSWTVNVIDADSILADAAWAREQGAEYVVVSLHWGEQYQVEPSSGQQALAETLLASPDIDVLLGHHAHVVQPIDWINDKLVVYSMGDLLSNIRGPSGGGFGIIVHLTATEQPDGRFITSEVQFTPTSVDSWTKAVLPISYTLDYGPERLHAELEANWERVMGGLTSLTDAETTAADWPPLLCRSHMATIVGTHAPDLLVGTPYDDVIVGLGGGDTIWGHTGNDLICGGDGSDHIAGGTGNDNIYGDQGDDFLHGDTGDDTLWGDAGDDTLEGGGGYDTLWASLPGDTLCPGSGANLCYDGAASVPCDPLCHSPADTGTDP
jgi:poly-gamma-glutamate capsule biosynthesis protein CapA/YwtB (metallophosphatase superfamily)